jgi:hypothetical protein
VVDPQQTAPTGTVQVRLKPDIEKATALDRPLGWEFFKKISMLRPTFAHHRFERSDRPDAADNFLAKSHSQTPDLDVRFEGWRGLPKISQASPREAGHKPAF